MAKYSAEEINTRVNELEIDDEIKIALMEDIADSISDGESEELTTLRAEIERATAELESLKEKYKARFLTAIETEEKIEETSEEYEESEVIDVKEI